jgi:hypothetical protein
MTGQSAAARAWPAHVAHPHAGGAPDLDERILAAIARVREPVRLVRQADGAIGIAPSGPALAEQELVGLLPPLYPEWLGDRAFAETHGCRFPYVVGEMARGFATADMVIAAVQAGLMGFFGSAGLPPDQIVDALR